MKVRMPVAVVAALVVAALATACTPNPSPSSSPTPTFSSEAEAFAAAEATYRAYVDALNHVDLSDPKTFEAVYQWTTGDANAGEKKSLTGMHADGFVVRGSSLVTRFEGTDANQPDGHLSAHACLDVANVDLRDSAGNSVVSPDRPRVQSVAVSFAQDPRSDTGLLISGLEGGDFSCS